MRSMLISSFLLLMFIACNNQKEAVNKNEIDVIDTQMAELKKEPPITRKDSIRLLNFWNRFRELLIKNDTNEIIKLSLKNVYCPVYQNNFNYYRDNKLVPLYFFLNAPYRDNYIKAFTSYLNKDTPVIFAGKLDSTEIINLGFQNNKEVENFSLTFSTKQIIENYTIYRSHSFEFIKNNDSFKFMGLKVDENGSRYQYKLMPCDNLYFPLYRKGQDSITNSYSLDTSLNKWYSKDLLGMKEPNIYISKDDDEIYRFTWLRSFHNPIAIRFEKHNNNYTLYTKELLDYQGYIPNAIKVNKEEEMTFEEWEKFKSKIEYIDFWKTAVNDPFPRPFDGAEWIMEGFSKNKYHFIVRTSPADKDYRDCCKYLLSLTRLNIPEKDQY
jgi:hypothetical protein